MHEEPVRRMQFDEAHRTDFAPTVVDYITTNSGLSNLGAVFMTFEQDGSSEPWTLRYEEVIYVVSGELTLTIVSDDIESTVVGRPSDVLTLHEGSTVRYGGTKGTRIFVSLYPVNWTERDDAS